MRQRFDVPILHTFMYGYVMYANGSTGEKAAKRSQEPEMMRQAMRLRKLMGNDSSFFHLVS